MPARTNRKNIRPAQKIIELDLESQIRGLLFLSGNERSLLEKLVKEYEFKNPIKDVILNYFEKGEYSDTIQCGQVFNLVRTNCTAMTNHGLSSKLFAESMRELGFTRGESSSKSSYRYIKLKRLKDAKTKRSKSKGKKRVDK